MISSVKPNLIILGSMKSGTTSLFELLKYSTDIHVSTPVKEPNYYLPFRVAQQELKRHGLHVSTHEEILTYLMSRNYKGEKWFCDASTAYTIGDNASVYKVPETIYHSNVNTRFIFIVRHPISRISSHYRHWRKRNAGNVGSFLNSSAGKRAILTSHYHFQINHYLEYFNIESFLFLEFDSLISEPKLICDRICKFLGVPGFSIPTSGAAKNISKVGKYSGHCVDDAILKHLKDDPNDSYKSIKDDSARFRWRTSISFKLD